MVSMLASSVVDRGFDRRWGQTKAMKVVCVASPLIMQHQGESAKTGWLGIRIMCSEWSDMSTNRLLFQWASTVQFCLESRHHHHLIECYLFSLLYIRIIAHLAWNKNHSFTHSLEIINVLRNIRRNIWYNKNDILLTYVGIVFAYFYHCYLIYIYTELHCKVFLLDKLWFEGHHTVAQGTRIYS